MPSQKKVCGRGCSPRPRNSERRFASQLLRRTEGEKLRTRDTGGKNGRRTSAGREFQDVAKGSATGFRDEQIARGIKGQAARLRKPGRKYAFAAIGSEHKDAVVSRVTFGGAEQVATAVECQTHRTTTLRERLWSGENSARPIGSK